MYQDYIELPVRTAAILTNSYVAGTVIGADNITQVSLENQLILYVDFTIGSLTTAEIKIEFSADGTNWVQETFESISAGVATETLGLRQFSASGPYRIAIRIKDRYIRVSAKGTGTLTSSSMAVHAIVGVA